MHLGFGTLCKHRITSNSLTSSYSFVMHPPKTQLSTPEVLTFIFITGTFCHLPTMWCGRRVLESTQQCPTAHRLLRSLGRPWQTSIPFSPVKQAATSDYQAMTHERLCAPFLLADSTEALGLWAFQLNSVLSPWFHFWYLNSGLWLYHLH